MGWDKNRKLRRLSLAYTRTLQHGPRDASSEKKSDENGGNASPVLTPRQRVAVQDVIDSILAWSSSASRDGSSGNDRFIGILISQRVNYSSINIEDPSIDGDDDAVVEVEGTVLDIMERIEHHLLPDPIDDEDAHKGTWDIIIDLYGRESTRVSEDRLLREREKEGGQLIRQTRRNLRWWTLCSVARVLIHFDFLTKGVLREGAFTSNEQ